MSGKAEDKIGRDLLPTLAIVRSASGGLRHCRRPWQPSLLQNEQFSLSAKVAVGLFRSIGTARFDFELRLRYSNQINDAKVAKRFLIEAKESA